NGMRFDSSALNTVLTSEEFSDRKLGKSEQPKVGTRVPTVVTGCALNLAGDLPSRFMIAKLDTGLAHPEERNVDQFKIRNLVQWTLTNRQQLIADRHTIVRAYLQECRRQKRTPAEVLARRKADGSRFGGPCNALRDAFLWAFPNLPDPFLALQASA